jgi:uncharacterized protein DUF5678
MTDRPHRKALKEKSARRYGAKNGRQLKKRLAIEFELDKQIQQHVGKWIAIADDKIVAVGDSVDEVMEVARRSGHSSPLVVRGPLTKEKVAYIL